MTEKRIYSSCPKKSTNKNPWPLQSSAEMPNKERILKILSKLKLSESPWTVHTAIKRVSPRHPKSASCDQQQHHKKTMNGQGDLERHMAVDYDIPTKLSTYQQMQ